VPCGRRAKVRQQALQLGIVSYNNFENPWSSITGMVLQKCPCWNGNCALLLLLKQQIKILDIRDFMPRH